MKFPFSAESVTSSEDFPPARSLMVHPSVGVTGLSELSLRSALDLNCIKYLIFFFLPSKYLLLTKFSCVQGAVAKPGVTVVLKQPEQVVLATLSISSLGQGLSWRKRNPARMRRESNMRK